MKGSQQIKNQLYRYCEQHIEDRINSIKERLNEIRESKNNETKSSVGDKYETGRSMLQLEEDKSKRQLAEAIKVKTALSNISITNSSNTIRPGSLVITDKANYFISIGMGEVKIKEGVYYCISAGSPIALAMRNKLVGDKIEFNGQVFRVNELY